MAVAALAAACTGSHTTAAFTPTFATVKCPADVQGIVVLKVTCGYLTVLENRSRPAGRTIKLFVTRIEPPQGRPKPDPMFVGADLAVAPDYAGIAPMAQRTDREIITMDARGVGHSTPNLACPEVEKLSASSLGVPTGDATMRSRFLNAVAACYHRLRREGIDLSSYDLHQNAADIEDLRKALRIRQWGLTATGTDSRVIVQALREYPQHVREVVLDGADFPQADPFSEAIRGTRHAIGQMDTTCSADPSCNRRFPHFAQAVATGRRTAHQQTGHGDRSRRIRPADKDLVRWRAIPPRPPRSAGGHPPRQRGTADSRPDPPGTRLGDKLLAAADRRQDGNRSDLL